MFMKLDAAGVPHWIHLLEVSATQALQGIVCGTFLLSSTLQHLLQAVDAVKDVQAVAPPPIAELDGGEQHTSTHGCNDLIVVLCSSWCDWLT